MLSIVAEHADHRGAAGHALVVRNGVAESLKGITAAGGLEIQAPRVHDRREGRRYTSAAAIMNAESKEAADRPN